MRSVDPQWSLRVSGGPQKKGEAFTIILISSISNTGTECMSGLVMSFISFHTWFNLCQFGFSIIRFTISVDLK